jgi:hypothetical protein
MLEFDFKRPKLDITNPTSVEAKERHLKDLTAFTGRSCGECSLCCYLLDVPQAGKARRSWCPHCKPGKGGCTI